MQRQHSLLVGGMNGEPDLEVFRTGSLPASLDRLGSSMLADDLSIPSYGHSPWSHEEQAQLEELLKKHPADSRSSHMERMLQVASALPNKTVRDVAMRVKWLNVQDSLRKRKPGDDVGKSKNKAGSKGNKTGAQPGGLAASSRHGSTGNLMAASAFSKASLQAPGLLPFHANGSGQHSPVPSGLPAQNTSSSDNAGAGQSISDGITGAVNQLGFDPHFGNHSPVPFPPAAQIPLPGSLPPDEAMALLNKLVEDCCTLLESIKVNMSECKVVENTELLGRYRDNICGMIGHMNAMPGVMQQMPPLPVQPKMELAAQILPPSRQMFGAMAPGMSPMPPPFMMPPFMTGPGSAPPFPMPFPFSGFPPGMAPTTGGAASAPAATSGATSNTSPPDNSMIPPPFPPPPFAIPPGMPGGPPFPFPGAMPFPPPGFPFPGMPGAPGPIGSSVPQASSGAASGPSILATAASAQPVAGSASTVPVS